MAVKRVLIRGKGGEEYSVTEATFRASYDEQGYTIQSYEDGTEYTATKQPSKGSATDKAEE